MRQEWQGAERDPEIGSRVAASKTWPKWGSTKRWLAGKKSTPSIGLETAARMNVQRNMPTLKFSVSLTDPHDGIGLRFALDNGGPEEGFCD